MEFYSSLNTYHSYYILNYLRLPSNLKFFYLPRLQYPPKLPVTCPPCQLFVNSYTVLKHSLLFSHTASFSSLFLRLLPYAYQNPTLRIFNMPIVYHIRKTAAIRIRKIVYQFASQKINTQLYTSQHKQVSAAPYTY